MSATKKYKFKVGDKVVGHGTESTMSIEGLHGVIVSVDAFTALVDFGKGFDGHNAGGALKTHTGWHVDFGKLSLYRPGCLKVYQIDNKVIAERDGKKGVARCNPTDTFDFLTGAKLAIERLEATDNYGKPFMPKFNECYWYIADNGNVVTTGYNCTYDWAMAALGNAFRTEKEAEMNKKEVYVRINGMVEAIKKGGATK